MDNLHQIALQLLTVCFSVSRCPHWMFVIVLTHFPSLFTVEPAMRLLQTLLLAPLVVLVTSVVATPIQQRGVDRRDAPPGL